MSCFSWGQKEGVWYAVSGDPMGIGYSGKGDDKNNPDSQSFHDLGPLPCGTYYIQAPVDDPKLGKYVMYLSPDSSNKMFGRVGFRIHGENIAHPGESSEGCIILNRIVRGRIWESGVRCLKVVPTFTSTVPDANDHSGDISLVT